ncbi:MAG: mandelate racemase/muconate lactonizing enzyme family protein [Verrucomicrobiae bacterium]|nr:mandelate racemase/muconate lactonizing enzyme family protein [Verrucomicrobiae bacterium]
MPPTVRNATEGHPAGIRVVGATLWHLPVKTRVPLKFGTETLTTVTCARVRVRIESRDGRQAEGWGETPLSVQWVWPHPSPYAERHNVLKAFTERLASEWVTGSGWGHPLILGTRFTEGPLASARAQLNAERQSRGEPPLPTLAALVASSPFDLAVHDAYGRLWDRPTYETYGPEFLAFDLASFLGPATGSNVSFAGRFPVEFLRPRRLDRLPAWHLVGGLDPLDPGDLLGDEPADGYPVLLGDWIRRDGLHCLKVKLRGNDPAWDLARLTRVGRIAAANGVNWLSADFNCTVEDPDYVCRILDQLRDEEPRTFGMLLYVEQPFPYELEEHPLAVQSVSARKPLFLDESAHDWRMVRQGRELGWTGVALKTCKTQTGALLAACWAQAHGMTLMVQDLTNPMLAQIPHCLLAAHLPTVMGVETNAMQYYPQASAPEAAVHPGLYQRRDGCVTLDTLRGAGFGQRTKDIRRELPGPVFEATR